MCKKIKIFDNIEKKIQWMNLETRFSRSVCSEQLPQLFGCRVSSRCRGKRDTPEDVGSTCLAPVMFVKVTHSPWRIPDGREKKNLLINNRGAWDVWIARAWSCFSCVAAHSVRLDYASSRIEDSYFRKLASLCSM